MEGDESIQKGYFDLWKKMTVDKGEMSSVLCENLLINEVEKKKRTRGTCIRDYEILRPFSIFVSIV